MRAGKEPPTLTEPALRDQLAEAERLEVAAGEALRRSAVDLLNEAAPLLADVDATLAARGVEDVDAIRGELDALNEHVTALGRTFAEAGEFLPLLDSLEASGRRAEGGIRLDRDHWRLYIEPVLGDPRAGAVEGADVAELLRDLRGRGMSESSCKHTLTVLAAIYRLARARRLVTRSPLDDLDPGERPRPRVTKRRRLDERALASLVRHAGEPLRVGVALLALTGMRLSEALALRWRDVDFVELDLYVGGQLTRGTRTKPARVVSRKSGAEPYTTLILPALEHELTRRLEAELADSRGQPDDFVLAMPRTGRPPHQRTLTDAVKAAATSAGLGHVTPQMLRRSFASIAARHVPDPAEAAHMTGHSLDVWVRHYVGRFGADARADARRRLLDAGLGVETAPPR